MRRRPRDPSPSARVVLPPLRRDRHGRGLRGALAPANTPIAKSRALRFDDLVVEAVERLDASWRDQLAKVEFAVEDVPSLEDWTRDWIPLARAFAATGALPARIVVYRRPVETRAGGPVRLRALLDDLVVEQVAELLGADPEEVDPNYGRPDV